MRKTIIICVLFLGQLGPHAYSADTTLEILLTNDDGYESIGLHSLRRTLIDAGHQITVVAPVSQQSGSGMKVSLSTIEFAQHQDDIWSVDGSPVDAVLIGIEHILKRPPDLVISGANFGQNLGANVVISGTVGAAAAATLHGIPAIAVSVGINLAERGASPRAFPSTLAAFPRAADFTALLIKKLIKERPNGAALIPSGLMLNVNYPCEPVSSIRGVRIAPIGEFGGFRLNYRLVGKSKTKLVSTVEHDPRGMGEQHTDTAYFGNGFVTISALQPSWDPYSNSAISAPEWLASLEMLSKREVLD